MAVAFKTVRIAIPQINGPFNSTEDVPFERKVREADVAIKLFKLDYVGGARPSDIVQVGVVRQSVRDETVEFTVTANYSASTYTGEVHVLVIADLE